MLPPPIRRRVRLRAFSLIELLVVIAIVALLIGILLPALSSLRRVAKLTVSLANERSIGQASYSYSSENDAVIAALWWNADWKRRRGSFPGIHPPLRDPIGGAGRTDNEARNIQALNYMNTHLSTNPAIVWAVFGLPVFEGISKSIAYNHMVLFDHLGPNGAADETVIDPADEHTLRMRDNRWRIGQFTVDDANPDGSFDSDTTPLGSFMSSYHLVPAAYTSDLNPGILPGTADVLVMRTADDFYYRSRRHTQVRFPSKKVWYMQELQFHGRDKLVYADERAEIPLLMFDGSAALRESSESNLGFDPDRPAFAGRSLRRGFAGRTYTGDRSVANAVTEWPFYYWRYRWTRGGLSGVDFGGGEIDTGQPN